MGTTHTESRGLGFKLSRKASYALEFLSLYFLTVESILTASNALFLTIPSLPQWTIIS